MPQGGTCGILPDPLAPHSAPPSSGLSAEVQLPGTLRPKKGAQCPRPHSPAWATPCRVWSSRTHEHVYGATCPAGSSEQWWAHFQGVCFGDSLRPTEVSSRNGLCYGRGGAGDTPR